MSTPIFPVANPILYGGVGYAPAPSGGTTSRFQPIGRPSRPTTGQGGASGYRFGLNNIPSPKPVGLPSPSVGTVLAQSRTVPPPALAGLPFATPHAGSSFGAPSGLAPTPLPVGHPLQNNIGEKY